MMDRSVGRMALDDCFAFLVCLPLPGQDANIFKCGCSYWQLKLKCLKCSLLLVQSHDGQPQSLCPTKLFADMESDCGPDGVLSCMDPLLPASGMPAGLRVARACCPVLLCSVCMHFHTVECIVTVT